MNVKEVYTLSHNLGEFYRGVPYPFLDIQTGNHRWYLREGKIAKNWLSYTPQELSNWLFWWVKE